MNKLHKILFNLLLFIVLLIPEIGLSQQTLKITTWNIEHLGTDGRGFGGGFGAGTLPRRTDPQLQEIGRFIKDGLQADILALQEIGITRIDNGVSRSEQLDKIVAALGTNWSYYLPPVSSIPPQTENMFNAILWNTQRVNRLNIFPMDAPDIELADKPLFKRKPIFAYFEVINNGSGTNDFLLINVHLASGQHNDENHLIAMTVLEHGIRRQLGANSIKESDRIILGDFNDNPYATTGSGKQKFTKALYSYMDFKGYKDLVTSDFHSTRVDNNLTSVIDHILVSKSAKRHLEQDKAEIHLPSGTDNSRFVNWRRNFSDHFPISIKIKIENSDDDVDF
ncbi:MAG: hypothetical protein IH886_03270 [Nitrospinae bacterium]|nr:hypothetical protein [Nitrospinota bacterium]